MIELILLFILSYIFTIIIIPFFINLLTDSQCLRNNYKGESIPVSMGIIFIPTITVTTLIYAAFFKGHNINELLILLIGILSMGFAGLMDDLLGNRSVTGLKGHLKSLLKSRLTTGGFKAIFGGTIALLISILITNDFVEIVMNTLLIALFTNFINLLDLRPGRAIKGFLLSAIVLILCSTSVKQPLFIIGLLGSSLAYFPYDLKAKSMMGDVGSNVLGISLGIASAYLNSTVKIIMLCVLIALHLYTEKYSLTATIENNKLLKFIDNLGR